MKFDSSEQSRTSIATPRAQEFCVGFFSPALLFPRRMNQKGVTAEWSWLLSFLP